MADHVIHHHSDNSDSGAASMAVVLIALLVIVGLAIFALRAFPLQGSTGSNLDVNVDTPAPSMNVDVNPADGQ